jgi:hypothetical protein
VHWLKCTEWMRIVVSASFLDKMVSEGNYIGAAFLEYFKA